MTDKEVFFEENGSLGLIKLNRPKALNALTLSMGKSNSSTDD